MRRMKRLLCLLLTLLLCPAAAETADAPVLEVHQMMLGCADGYLLRLGEASILIDGGNANPRLPTDEALDYLRAAGVDTLDAVIITHWHLDHCMSLNKVLAEFGRDDTVVYSPADRVPEEIDNGTVTVKIGPLVRGSHRQMKPGDALQFGGMTLTCIGPDRLNLNGGCNQDSLNLIVRYGQRKLLFTGDFAQSAAISGAYRELCADVDVLKFPHHAIEPFEIGTTALRVVSPEYVLVPGVANKYKVWNYADNVAVRFPKENVLTNADGHVVILTDGGERFDVLTQQDPADYAPKMQSQNATSKMDAFR